MGSKIYQNYNSVATDVLEKPKFSTGSQVARSDRYSLPPMPNVERRATNPPKSTVGIEMSTGSLLNLQIKQRGTTTFSEKPLNESIGPTLKSTQKTEKES